MARVTDLRFGDVVQLTSNETVIFIGMGPSPDLVGTQLVTYWNVAGEQMTFVNQYPETQAGYKVKNDIARLRDILVSLEVVGE